MNHIHKYKRLSNTVAMRPSGQSKQDQLEDPINQLSTDIKRTSNMNQAYRQYPKQDNDNSEFKDRRINQLQLELKTANQSITFLKETNARMMNKIAAYERKFEEVKIIQDQLNFRRQQERQMQEHMQNYQKINAKLKQKIVQLQAQIRQTEPNHFPSNQSKNKLYNQMSMNSFQASFSSSMRASQQKNMDVSCQIRQNSYDKYNSNDRYNPNSFYALNSNNNYLNVQKRKQQNKNSQQFENEANWKQQQRHPSFQFFRPSQERKKSLEDNEFFDKQNIRKQRKSIGSTNQFNTQKQNHPITPKSRVNIDFNLIMKNHNVGGFQGKKRVFL